MKMTDHQKQLWQSMIDSIQQFINGETCDFYGLVGDLEGMLDASEIKNKELVERWYDFWTPLEIRRSIEGNDIEKKNAMQELVALQIFLKTQLKNEPVF